jgi:hypothetical protein
MSQKSKILLIDNIIYISQKVPLEKYNAAYSTCDYCDCHVSGLNTGHCLAMDNEKNVPCGPFTCFKKLTRGL